METSRSNAGIAHRVFAGEAGPYRDIIVLNAAAGLVVGGAVDSITEGIARAQASIDEGAAAAALAAAVRACPSPADLTRRHATRECARRTPSCRAAVPPARAASTWW